MAQKTSGKTVLNIIYRTILFLVTVALIIYVFPKERTFMYEYQKGSPWLHENLIAPFMFSIYKTDEELRFEYDSVLKDFSPYCMYDDEVSKDGIKRFKDEFNNKWNKYVTDYYQLEVKDDSILLLPEALSSVRPVYYDFSYELLQFIYQKGVLKLNDNLAKIKEGEHLTFLLVKDNVAEEIELDAVFDLETAKLYIADQVSKRLNENDYEGSVEADFITLLDLYQYLLPNIVYDAETSENVRSNLKSDISLTKGIVQEGEGIISKGDVVTEYKFKKLESLRKEYEQSLGSMSNFYIILAGQLMLVLISIAVLFLFLFSFRKEILLQNSKLVLILLLVVLFVAMSSFIVSYTEYSIYVIPFAVLPVLIRAFYDTRIAFFVHLVCILIVGFVVPNAFEFLFLNIITGIVAVFSLSNMQRRRQLLLTTLFVFLTYSTIFIAFVILHEGEITKANLFELKWFAYNSALILLAYPLMYLFEKSFGFVSDLTLMEISDTNHPLLRKLAEVAPGTFQHVLQVANLSEAAVREIGGNPLLVRTGALYHDVGKMDTPHYFVENQGGGRNPHDRMEPLESAAIILNHIKKGVEIARKYKLPQQVVDFISMHHGDRQVMYFLNAQKKNYPEDQLDIKAFTYDGPTPNSKETAVLMMADACEAASRSLKEVSAASIAGLVEKIIDGQVAEKQFDKVDLTFKEVKRIKEVFIEKLQNIYHSRIEYPDEKEVS